MMKKTTIASKYKKSWTVLLVDGQGRIRRIPHFRQKLWAIIGLSVAALAIAAVMGLLYGGTLRKQMALAETVGTLEKAIAALQQENELLKARAVRMEAQAVTLEKTTAPEARVASVSPKVEAAPAPPPTPPETGETAPSTVPPPAAKPTAADSEQKIEPEVDVEGLKLAYRADTETIEAAFVIKNTGQGSAGGRAVVVLHADDGSSPLRFALPSVPLRNGQPLGNQGRRFSISRFMTLTLQRKFAEPGTQFVRAAVYAYTLEGKQLLEKPFDVTLAIPEKETAPAAVVTPPPPSADTGTIAAPLGLELPEPKPQDPTGAQP
jgi:hypothetical protein